MIISILLALIAVLACVIVWPLEPRGSLVRRHGVPDDRVSL
jgi:hypothetical protein